MSGWIVLAAMAAAMFLLITGSALAAAGAFGAVYFVGLLIDEVVGDE